MERLRSAAPLILLVGSLGAFFAIGILFDLFGHTIDWRNPAGWVQYACLPLAIFGGAWAMLGIRGGLKTAGFWTLLLLGAAIIGMLRH